MDVDEPEEEEKEAIPSKSLVAQARKVTSENLVELLREYPYLSQCYSYIRKKLLDFSEETREFENKINSIMNLGFTKHEALCSLHENRNQRWNNLEVCAEWLFENQNRCVNMNPPNPLAEKKIPSEAKHILSENMPLEDILWWYDELHSNEVEMEVYDRLEDANKNKNYNVFNEYSQRSNYGKLMDRLLYFREKKYKFADSIIPQAEDRLKNIKVLKSENIKISVLGDASGSMEVAIKSSSIISSLLSVALNADLMFFNSNAIKPEMIPRNVKETIKVVENTQAIGGTSMASALWHYYNNKIKIDLFILVSDEGENEKYNNYWFHELFEKYLKEINSHCQLFLVSFVKVGEEGTIMQRLKSKNLQAKQFRLHPEHPDTSKFDSLLGMISLVLSIMQENYDVCVETLIKQQNIVTNEAVKFSNIIFSYL